MRGLSHSRYVPKLVGECFSKNKYSLVRILLSHSRLLSMVINVPAFLNLCVCVCLTSTDLLRAVKVMLHSELVEYVFLIIWPSMPFVSQFK